MTIKNYTLEKKNPKHSQIWEWDETPEVLATLEKINASSKLATPQQKGAKKTLKAPNAPTGKAKT